MRKGGRQSEWEPFSIRFLCLRTNLGISSALSLLVSFFWVLLVFPTTACWFSYLFNLILRNSSLDFSEARSGILTNSEYIICYRLTCNWVEIINLVETGHHRLGSITPLSWESTLKSLSEPGVGTSMSLLAVHRRVERFSLHLKSSGNFPHFCIFSKRTFPFVTWPSQHVSLIFCRPSWAAPNKPLHPHPLPREFFTVRLKGLSSPAVSAQSQDAVWCSDWADTYISIPGWEGVGLGLPHCYQHRSCLVYSFTQSRKSAWSLGRAARYINAHSIAGPSACRGKSMQMHPRLVLCPALSMGLMNLLIPRTYWIPSEGSLREFPDFIQMQCKDVLSPLPHL